METSEVSHSFIH